MADGNVYKIRLGNILKKDKIMCWFKSKTMWGNSNFKIYSCIDNCNDSYIYFGKSNSWNHEILFCSWGVVFYGFQSISFLLSGNYWQSKSLVTRNMSPEKKNEKCGAPYENSFALFWATTLWVNSLIIR